MSLLPFIDSGAIPNNLENLLAQSSRKHQNNCQVLLKRKLIGTSIKTIRQVLDVFMKNCEFQLKQEKIMEELKAEKFDLAISRIIPSQIEKDITLHGYISTQNLLQNLLISNSSESGK